VLPVGVLLGSWRGAAALFLYLVEGAGGPPVFAGGISGPAHPFRSEAVGARPLGALGHREFAPRLRRQGRRPISETRRFPVGVVARYPIGTQLSPMLGPPQQRERQFRFGLVSTRLFGHVGGRAPLWVLRPLSMQIEPFVHQRSAL